MQLNGSVNSHRALNWKPLSYKNISLSIQTSSAEKYSTASKKQLLGCYRCTGHSQAVLSIQEINVKAGAVIILRQIISKTWLLNQDNSRLGVARTVGPHYTVKTAKQTRICT